METGPWAPIVELQSYQALQLKPTSVPSGQSIKKNICKILKHMQNIQAYPSILFSSHVFRIWRKKQEHPLYVPYFWDKKPSKHPVPSERYLRISKVYRTIAFDPFLIFKHIQHIQKNRSRSFFSLGKELLFFSPKSSASDSQLTLPDGLRNISMEQQGAPSGKAGFGSKRKPLLVGTRCCLIFPLTNRIFGVPGIFDPQPY